MRMCARRKRPFLAMVCFVVVVAIAMAPIASAAFCVELVPVPELFASLVSTPLATSSAPTARPAEHSPFLPRRAPPIAQVL